MAAELKSDTAPKPHSERGAVIAEYALILGLIGVAAIVGLAWLNTAVAAKDTSLATSAQISYPAPLVPAGVAFASGCAAGQPCP